MELAKRTPNFVGVYMDDFFTGKKQGKFAVLRLDKLKEIQQQLKGSGMKLDLFVTLYTSQMGLPLRDYLKRIDVITLWTWKTADLVHLESNLKKFEKLAPASQMMLGCCLVDYHQTKSVSIPAMRHQGEAGLDWLRQGRIEVPVRQIEICCLNEEGSLESRALSEENCAGITTTDLVAARRRI